jgi:hypothetical protein
LTLSHPGNQCKALKDGGRKRGHGQGRGRGGGGGGELHKHPWDNTTWPPGDAAREAAEAADETMEALANPAFCKIMLMSMVSGRGCHSSTVELNMSRRHPLSSISTLL